MQGPAQHTPGIRWLQLRPSRALLAVGLCLVVAIAAVTVAATWYLRAAALADQQRQIAQLNLVLSEQASRAIEEVDLVLLATVERIRSLRREAAATGQPVDPRAYHDMLVEQFAGMVQVRALFLVGANGVMLADSRRYPLPSINVADRPYFIEQQHDRAVGAYFSEPLIGRVDGLPSIAMSRRVDAPDGSFRGVVVAAVEPRYFQSLYASLELGAGGSVALYRRDGVLLTAFPAETPEAARSWFLSREFAAGRAKAKQGVFQGADSAGNAKLASFRAIGHFPLLVSIAMEEAAALAQWRRQAAIFGAGAAGSALLVFVLLPGLSRQLKRQEALTGQLANSEQRFRDFTEASSDWIWEMGPDMRFTYVSERFHEVTGTPVAQMLGQTRSEVVDLPTDDPIWQVHIDDLNNRRPFRGLTYPHRNPDGDVRWIRTSGKPVYAEDGTFLGYRGTGSDVTVEHLAEERARLAQERLRDAVEFLADGFVLFDADDRLVMCNSRYREIHARTPQSLIPGRRFEEILHDVAASGEVTVPDGDTDGYILRRLERHRNPQGPFEITSEGRVIRIAERRTRDGFIVGLHSDITEIKKRELALIEAKQAAEMANRAKSEFLAHMSHELRTPLNAIIGFAEVISGQVFGESSPKYIDYARDIRNSGEHLLALISDILDMSKIESGHFDFYEEEVSIADVVGSCLAMVQGRARDANVKLMAPAALPEVELHADRRAVMQVMLNLLTNAIKFTGAGGSVTVRIECGPELTLIVEDTGVGIPPESMPHVFEPFQRGAAHISRKAEGTGLGLAISRKLMERHGGTLDLESTPGVGTIARAVFPASRLRKPAAAAGDAAPAKQKRA